MTDENVRIEWASLIAARTKTGAVELTLRRPGEPPYVLQMDLAAARSIAANLAGAIEAAISDEIFYKLLTERLGLEPAAAGVALLDLRELRQGSRGTVYPT
jgi:hypothetical protein